jgi:hypothetical protein
LDVGAVTFDRFGLGARPSAAPSNHLTGDIAEVLVYSAALADADRETLEAYLGYKWGITV